MKPKRVTLRPSGRSFDCAPTATVLDAARAAGLHLAYGCRTGSCGVCRSRLLHGSVDYEGFAPPGTVPLGLTAEESAAGQVLLCQARARSDLELEVREVEGVAGLVIKTLPARIERIERLAHDVMGLWLKLPKVERLQFLAGQYLDVLLGDGSRRSFSLANAPWSAARHAASDAELLELHVRLVPGGSFTTDVFERLAPKALLRVQGPLGSFFLREDSTRPILMLAGGTGFAPLKGIIEHAAEVGLLDGSGRTVHLYWGVRAQRDLYLGALPERWAEQHPWFRWTPVLSEPDAGWQGRTGFVHDALLADHAAALAGFDVYMAGPPPMCRAARAAFATAGLPDGQLYYDSFEFNSKT